MASLNRGRTSVVLGAQYQLLVPAVQAASCHIRSCVSALAQTMHRVTTTVLRALFRQGTCFHLARFRQRLRRCKYKLSGIGTPLQEGGTDREIYTFKNIEGRPRLSLGRKPNTCHASGELGMLTLKSSVSNMLRGSHRRKHKRC